MEKKGLSGIIVVVLLIVLTMAAITIFWTTTRGVIEDNIDKSESCFNIFDKVYLETRFTCYDEANNELKFYIGLRDIEVDSVVVFVTGDLGAKSFKIPDETDVEYVSLVSGEENEILPEENAGLVYKINL